jgi:hypothetical protein
MLPQLVPLALAVLTHVAGNQLHAPLKLLFCLSYMGGWRDFMRSQHTPGQSHVFRVPVRCPARTNVVPALGNVPCLQNLLELIPT